MDFPSLSGSTKYKPKPNNGKWKFPVEMGLPYVGFIYIIRDRYMKKFYIGKKHFLSRERGRDVISNWKKYNTSSKILKEMFAERPAEEFDFIVLEMYKGKASLTFAECWSLCKVEAPTCKNWYNTMIDRCSWNIKEKITDRHKERLELAVNWHEFSEE